MTLLFAHRCNTKIGTSATIHESHCLKESPGYFGCLHNPV